MRWRGESQLFGLGQTKGPSPVCFYSSRNGGTWQGALLGLTLHPGLLGTICSTPPPSLWLGRVGAVKESGPPSRLPEGWEMSRQGNENLLLIQA